MIMLSGDHVNYDLYFNLHWDCSIKIYPGTIKVMLIQVLWMNGVEVQQSSNWLIVFVEKLVGSSTSGYIIMEQL